MRKTAAAFANFSCSCRWVRSASFRAFGCLAGKRTFLRSFLFGQRLAQDHGLDIEILILIQQWCGDRTRLSGIFGVSGFLGNLRGFGGAHETFLLVLRPVCGCVR